MNVRCSDKLRDPKKLIEVVNFGINNPELATSCLGEVLTQLYHTNKHHVLICMDGYNDWFNKSGSESFRYENIKAYNGTIPPKDFAIVRMLMKFDGHMMRNGFKLMATTHYR